ncbi:hypothetical protein JOM49_007342 [Amycolatopsis magusensis]|uniref:Uncharacterized protein n=1 Tax=Amycolatopsis magusensis TaxID=882444 RepID=A0ABS4Q4T5_9PSEU|nr:hypothetical protein [Amycolatopsis magusensis]
MCGRARMYNVGFAISLVLLIITWFGGDAVAL